jgi:DNA polymerase-3 subunit gamma/tau
MSNKKSLYLKYRPQQLADLVGQKQIVATLKKAAEIDFFSHAYLFGGNHGCGKTSTARILANLMTCEKVVDGNTCGECQACKTVLNGSAQDVIEIDGATQRSIDNVKEIIDNAQWGPAQLSKKIYIIDEVHQLSKEAISALLKITEEPPPYLAFILCTTETRKILPTILSRCQRFNFKKIYAKDIANRLYYISEKEGIKINKSAIYMIAKIARGSMRDAIGDLEQIATLAGDKEITEGHISKYLGATDRQAVINIVKSMVIGDLALLMDQVNDVIMAAVSTKEILFEISEVLRNIGLLGIGGINKDILDLPDNEIVELEKIRSAVGVSKISNLATIFSKLEKEISYNINERWIMEATLINCSYYINKK